MPEDLPAHQAVMIGTGRFSRGKKKSPRSPAGALRADSAVGIHELCAAGVGISGAA